MVVAAASGAGPVGTQRLLVLPVTWGPRPWSPEEIRREAIEATDAWIARSSFGRVAVAGFVAPWLDVDHSPYDCAPVRLADKARAAAARRGLDVREYDRIAILHPRGSCPWSGLAGTNEFWLNGVLRSKVVVHELGHTWGLDHANALVCAGEECHGVEYGDPYSPMGRGDADFTAFEKFRLGWIGHVASAPTGEPQDVDVGALERPSPLPQAFVARSAAGQFWLEYRADAGGVLVHADATPAGRPMAAQPNLLVEDAARPGTPLLRAGDRFVARGAFAVGVAALGDRSARLAFTWTDETPPPAPRLAVRRSGARVVVRWRGADPAGSGLSHFEVALAGRTRRVAPDPLGLEQRLALTVPGSGPLSVTVAAYDRAGNRRSAVRRVAAAAPARARVLRTRVDVGGHRLYLECRGTGAPTTVFDAGLNETGGSWSSVLAAVARGGRACTYDRAGLGASDRRRGPSAATSGTIAEELRTLLRRARVVGPYVLVGHSFGGVNIRVYAARDPGDIAGLVFVDSADADVLAARGTGFDGAQRVDFRPAASELRDATLGSTPAIVLFSSAPREASAEVARRSSNSLLVFAPRSGHHIHQDRPALVVEAVRRVRTAARTGAKLPACEETALVRHGGECVAK